MPFPTPLSAIDWGGWAILALMAPGLIVLVGIVAAYALRRSKRGQPAVPAPGYYHVMGVDRRTGERREATFHADTLQAARGRAEMQGMIVTDIRQVDESLR